MRLGRLGYVHIFLEEEMILPIQETANDISAPSTYIRIGMDIPTIQIGEEIQQEDAHTS